jgi:phosphatidylserine decarboxylase
MTIHKEGYPSIFLALIVLSLLNALFYYTLEAWPLIRIILFGLSLVFFSLVVYFFRSPSFKMNEIEDGIVSPADGTVVAIEEIKETEYFNDKRVQISVFMSPLNVHINRYPISGEVKYFQHHHGHFHVAWHPKSSEENERTSTVVRHENGTEVLFKQIAGAVARRIVSYADVPSVIVQGEQCGFIKFGSRVDVLVPTNANIHVSIGQKVKGGMSVLASIT